MEARSNGTPPARPAPSLARAVEALRAIRGQRLRTRPESRVVAMRGRLV